MQMIGQTWLNLVTWTCGSWSEGQHDLYFKLQWFCLISWRLFDVCASYFRIRNQYDLTFDLKVNVGYCDIYFMVQWLCFIPCWLFHVWTSLLGIMTEYDPTHDLKINVCHCDLYFMVHWFCLITQRLFDGWVSYFRIMRTCDPILYLKINETWPVFHGLVILLNIFKIIWWMNIIIGIMDQCDTKIDLINYM